MKNTRTSFIIIFAATISISISAMKTAQLYTPKNILHITAVEKLQQAAYITNNTAVILHRLGCSIVNTETNTVIKKICNHPNPLWTSGIELHPNKTKMAFFYHTARSDTPKITIYDLATGKREWSKKKDGPSILHASFNPINDTIALGCGTSSKIAIYNYKTNEIDYFDIESLHESAHDRITIKLLQFHPTKSHKLYVKKNRLNYINLTRNQFKISSNAIYAYEFHTKESHKAKYIGDKVIISISNHSKKYKSTINYRENFSDSFAIRQVKFHPNDAILTILDMANHISYWDIATGTMICKTTSLPTDNEYSSTAYLSFSPDGKNIMFTQSNADYGSSIIIPIPFIVRYALTKKQSIFLYFLIKNYLHYNEVLPQDIINLLISTTMERHLQKEQKL